MDFREQTDERDRGVRCRFRRLVLVEIPSRDGDTQKNHPQQPRGGPQQQRSAPIPRGQERKSQRASKRKHLTRRHDQRLVQLCRGTHRVEQRVQVVRHDV